MIKLQCRAMMKRNLILKGVGYDMQCFYHKKCYYFVVHPHLQIEPQFQDPREEPVCSNLRANELKL